MPVCVTDRLQRLWVIRYSMRRCHCLMGGKTPYFSETPPQNLSSPGIECCIVSPQSQEIEMLRTVRLTLVATGMRFSPAEAERVGLNNDVVMPDGDIISVPAVMHNLHCLVGFSSFHPRERADNWAETIAPNPPSRLLPRQLQRGRIFHRRRPVSHV